MVAAESAAALFYLPLSVSVGVAARDSHHLLVKASDEAPALTITF
jgi:hypothetical protein